MKFKKLKVEVPNHDCDVELIFPNGKIITVQARPSNADVDYNGSLDILLPDNTAVTNWEGEDMKPAKAVRRQPHTRMADQLVMELPYSNG